MGTELAELATICNGVISDEAFYVYYLCDAEKVLYVGQSSRILGRMTHHIAGRSKKSFRYVMYRRCASKLDMDRLEASEIERLRPPLNVRQPYPPRSDEEKLAATATVQDLLSSLLFPGAKDGD